MHIGLLNCFTTEEEADTGGPAVELFSELLRPAAPTWTLRDYRVTEMALPAGPAACDGYLISGSPQGVYDDHPWIAALSAFIRRAFAAGRPQVGVCFGHQILAHALGGRAQKADRGWGIGLHRFELTAERPWMSPALSEAALYFCHQDQVVTLPAEARRLGGDERCPNAMFVIGRQVLGIQGHPEFTRPFMANLVEYKRPVLGDRLADAAAASLETGEPDNRVMASWIVNFFTSYQA